MTAGIAVALGTAVIAGVCDLRTSRIPNALTYSAIAIGLCLAAFTDPSTAGTALAGLAAGAGLGLLLFFSGGLGGGDVKLIAALGTLLGAGRVVEVVAIAISLAALPALAMMVRAGLHRGFWPRLRLSLMNLAVMGVQRTAIGAATAAGAGADTGAAGGPKSARDLRLQFAPALALAAMLVVFVPAARFLAASH